MTNYRRTNSTCVNCGGEIPFKVEKQTDGAVINYTCENCHSIILEGVVAHDGEPADARITPNLGKEFKEVLLPERVNWSTWEIWATGTMSVTLINGRVVNGDEELMHFVEKIEDIYDRNN